MMNEIKSCTNYKDLCDKSAELLEHEMYYVPISHDELYDLYSIEFYSIISKRGFWIINADSNFMSLSEPKTYGRSYCMGFIHRRFLELYGSLLAAEGYHICVHEHNPYYRDNNNIGIGSPFDYNRNKAYIITGNKIIKDNLYGILIEYSLLFDELGQPKIEPVEYIRYSKNLMAKLKDYFDNTSIYEELYDEYIQVTIVDKTFDNNNNFQADIEKWLLNINNPEWPQEKEEYLIRTKAMKNECRIKLDKFFNDRTLPTKECPDEITVLKNEQDN